jgi:hypothetical protein
MNDNLFLLKGGLGKKQLKKIFEEIDQVEEGSPRIIRSTGKYLGEEIDMPFLDTLLLTFSVSWHRTLSQYVIRLHRDYHGKDEVLNIGLGQFKRSGVIQNAYKKTERLWGIIRLLVE